MLWYFLTFDTFDISCSVYLNFWESEIICKAINVRLYKLRILLHLLRNLNKLNRKHQSNALIDHHQSTHSLKKKAHVSDLQSRHWKCWSISLPCVFCATRAVAKRATSSATGTILPIFMPATVRSVNKDWQVKRQYLGFSTNQTQFFHKLMKYIKIHFIRSFCQVHSYI